MVKKALDDARTAMQTKEMIMRYLDTGMTHVGLLISLGSGAAEVWFLPLACFILF